MEQSAVEAMHLGNGRPMLDKTGERDGHGNSVTTRT